MLIGLTGAAGAGKDSAALVLTAAGFRSIAFADALRTEVAAAWHIDPRLLTERTGKDAPQPALAIGHATHRDWLAYAATQGWSLVQARSPRWVLQAWGEWRRIADPHHWLRHVHVWAMDQMLHGWDDLCVTDVRHPAEAAMLQQLGGHLLRVHRPGLQPLPADTASHASERHHATMAVDGDIHNTGTLADLSHEVWRVVRGLGSRPAALAGAA